MAARSHSFDECAEERDASGAPSTLRAFRDRVTARLEARGNYPRWVLLTALSGMFATTFPVTILPVSLGDIARDLNTTEPVLAWVVSAPLLGAAVALPVLGKFGDLYGHRRVFLTGFGIATVITAVTALAWDALSLISFRTAGQMIGSATQPTAMALIMSVYAPEDRVKALGYWSLVAAGAPAVGLVAGGPMVDAVGWRPIFLLQSVAAFVAFAAATVVLRETKPRERVRFDVVGALSIMVAAGGAMLALQQGRMWGWDHPLVLTAAVLAPLGAVNFVSTERRVSAPLLPLHFLGRRNFSATLVGLLAAGGAYMGGFILAPLVLRFVFGYSLSATALIMLVRPVAFSASSPLGGHLATRVGERRMAMAGMGTLGTALFVIAVGVAQHSLPILMAGLVMQGLGNGLGRPSMSASLVNSVEEEHFGIASAAQRMSWMVGSALGITILTVIYGGNNVASAFVPAYIVGGALGLVAFGAASLITSTEREPAPPVTEDEIPAERGTEAGEVGKVAGVPGR